VLDDKENLFAGNEEKSRGNIGILILFSPFIREKKAPRLTDLKSTSIDARLDRPIRKQGLILCQEKMEALIYHYSEE
jgi:hypothetical protein